MLRQPWLLPGLFVTLFGSAYPIVKIGFTDASPMAFLAARLAIAVVILTCAALVLRSPWPRGRALVHVIVAGLLTVGLFSIPAWIAVGQGVSPALCALLIALQPLLVAAVASSLLGERLNARTLVGLLVAFAGVAFVVGHALTIGRTPCGGVFLAVLSLLGLSAGTLYQKRFCSGMNPFSGGVVQSGASAIAAAAVGVLTGSMHITWTVPFSLCLAYMSIGVSVGAVTMLYVMLREGTATRVGSMFYLIPVASALASYVLLRTPIAPVTAAGIAIVAAGVTITNMKPSPVTVRFARRHASFQNALRK
jgi:drug/metabolite transporter (DMT)-like permease